jgi:predicted CXXCH cytochrome family protein
MIKLSSHIYLLFLVPILGTIELLNLSLDSPSSDSSFHRIEKLDTTKTCTFCHEEILKSEEVHSPVKKDCERCHISTGVDHPESGDLAFNLENQVPDLCYSCHDRKDEYESVHDPIQKGDCLTCHSAHGSDHLYLLKADPVSNLCYECHDLNISENDHIHGAVEEGQCQGCHDPHQSDNDHLLTFEGPSLCRSCHRDTRGKLRLENVHQPFKEDCFLCHKPHSSKEAHLADLPVKELCSSCHEEFFTGLTDSQHVHGALEGAESCIECHSPHSSDISGILKKENKDLCLDCHNKEYHSDDGTIPNIAEQLTESKVIHPPIEDGGCISCHEPHSANENQLLVASFPSTTYTKADPSNFELCFQCHNEQLFANAEADTTTQFRNGNENLHFVHMNGEKGRNCTVCHETHGSMKESLITESTKFGNWDMPVRYTKLEDGGSCATGCHSEKTYSRR